MLTEPTRPPVRLAISIPQSFPTGTFDPASFRANLARAEQLGFTSAWTGEQILGTDSLLGPLETLGYAAACTENIRLGCAAFVSPHHSPLHLAKSLSSLDQLSRGRLEMVLVTGGAQRSHAPYGFQRDTLIARFSEGLRLMEKIWTEPRANFYGRFWQLPKQMERLAGEVMPLLASKRSSSQREFSL